MHPLFVALPRREQRKITCNSQRGGFTSFQFFSVSTFTAILEPDAKGMLHLPVPMEWGNARIRVKAELEPLSGEGNGLSALAKGFGCLRGRISMSPDFDSPLEDFKDYTP